MEIKEELEIELEELKKTKNAIYRNPVFIDEEINELNILIRQIEEILSVLK